MDRPLLEPLAPSQASARVRELMAEVADLLVVVAAGAARPAEPDQVYSLTEVAQRLGISDAGVRRMRRRGELRTISLGPRRVVVTASELARITHQSETE